MGSVPMPTCAPKVTEKMPDFAMRSAMMADDTLSSSMPPYSSGTSTTVNPSSLAFFSSSRVNAKFLLLDRVDVGHDLLVREILRWSARSAGAGR